MVRFFLDVCPCRLYCSRRSIDHQRQPRPSEIGSHKRVFTFAVFTQLVGLMPTNPPFKDVKLIRKLTRDTSRHPKKGANLPDDAKGNMLNSGDKWLHCKRERDLADIWITSEAQSWRSSGKPWKS